MDYASVFAVSAAGMDVERLRVEVAAQNLANAHDAHHPGVAGYQPQRVLAQAMPFAQVFEGAALAIPAAAIEPSAAGPRLAQEPGHPLANEQGLVAYPDVDPATEMLTLMSAMRAYEADLAALNTGRTLALKALEIGRGA